MITYRISKTQILADRSSDKYRYDIITLDYYLTNNATENINEILLSDDFFKAGPNWSIIVKEAVEEFNKNVE